MLPDTTRLNAGHGRLRYSVSRCRRRLRLLPLAIEDGSHLGLRQLGRMVSLSTGELHLQSCSRPIPLSTAKQGCGRYIVAPLANRIQGIVRHGSEKQMIRSDTARVVAFVAHKKVVRYCAKVKNPRHAMGAMLPAVKPEPPVGIELVGAVHDSAASPNPTVARCIDVLPESRNVLLFHGSIVVYYREAGNRRRVA